MECEEKDQQSCNHVERQGYPHGSEEGDHPVRPAILLPCGDDAENGSQNDSQEQRERSQ